MLMSICRYNVLVVERDYRSLTPSKWLSWADFSVSQGAGILLRPFSSLSSAAGGRGLIRTVTALSLQYQACWVILYQKDQNRSADSVDMYRLLSVRIGFLECWVHCHWRKPHEQL